MGTRFKDRRSPEAMLVRRAAVCALVFLISLGIAAALLREQLSLSSWFVPKTLLLFLLALAALRRFLPDHLPHRRLGPANQVTLLRLALTALFGGCLGEAQHAVAWFAPCIALSVLALDGVDGWLARRGGWLSAFGARFDMETDALLGLLMALLVWQLDKAGPWVLLSGSMRYLFLAAARFWPWLLRPLPPSRRRKTVCVLQILSLLTALLPVVSSPWSGVIALGGLALLCYSFWVDVIWLRRHAGRSPEEAIHERM